jgi:tRNA modification GTPase
MSDTIFALSSGPPPAGVAVIRVSGPGVRQALGRMIDSVPEPRRATVREVKGPDGSVIDQALAIFFAAPKSFTGEDLAEFHVHGGRAVVGAMLTALGKMERFRLAEAGEFTRRAFLNRRLDLAQVEGLADLVQAETDAQRRAALRQAAGALGKICEGWRDRLLGARALVEAGFDFSDEADVLGDEIEKVAWEEVRKLAAEIGAYLAQRTAERIREGLEVVILGPPNAGKSSLLNALARRDVAIVTPEAGTTRDLIEVHLDLGGYPVTVVDTAGLREAAGAAEREGIRRAEERASRADMVIWLGDLMAGPIKDEPLAANVIRVAGKADLFDSEEERLPAFRGYDMAVSPKTGAGLAELVERISRFARESFAPGEGSLITRERHRLALGECVEALNRSLDRSAATELRAEELRRATDALGRISGRVGVEDLLDVIFREFCIGK